MKVTKTYFMVMVADMSRAMAFYRDVFGLSVAFSSPEWTDPEGNVLSVAQPTWGS